jgi:hypothetical protein
LVEDRPGFLRELPAWMCDAATCRAMTRGAPLVRVEALQALASVLAAMSRAQPSTASSDHPAAAEAVSTPDLLQALADLLVAAVGRPARDMPTRETGDEPEDHG